MKFTDSEASYSVLSKYYGARYVAIHSLATLCKYAKEPGVEIICVHQITISEGAAHYMPVDSVDDLLASGGSTKIKVSHCGD